jgi:tetratricopeptide (TPR) repeat protein
VVPETVHAVLAARLDRLPPAAKRLVQTAAVVGMQLTWPLLQAVTGLSEADLHTGLTHLQSAEFLYETQVVPELTYTFKHALTHEVAYGSLLRERRRGLHAGMVEALEALAPDRVADQVERLAHHALRGEMWGKAVMYCQQAGARADARAALREAVAYFDQALEALAHLPEHRDTHALAIDLRLALASALSQLGESRRGLTLLGEAEARARSLDDRARLARVLAGMAFGLRATGDLDGSVSAGQQALELAATLGARALQRQASYQLGLAYQSIGAFERAAALLRQNIEAADREACTPTTRLRIISQAWLGLTLGVLGAFAEGRHHGEEALRLAAMEGRRNTPIIAHNCLGHLYLTQGDLEPAIRVLEQGLALCRASSERNQLRRIAAALGYAYALQGRLAEGRALLEEGLSESLSTGVLAGQAYRFAWLSEVCRVAGCYEEAWQHARQALDLAQQQKARGNEALALHQLGVVQAHAAPPRRRAGRSLLSAGPGHGGRARHAPTPSAWPPRSRHPLHHCWPATAGPGSTVHSHRDVSRHGNDLVAPPGRGGAGTNRRGSEASRSSALSMSSRRRYCSQATSTHHGFSPNLCPKRSIRCWMSATMSRGVAISDALRCGASCAIDLCKASMGWHGLCLLHMGAYRPRRTGVHPRAREPRGGAGDDGPTAAGAGAADLAHLVAPTVERPTPGPGPVEDLTLHRIFAKIAGSM